MDKVSYCVADVFANDVWRGNPVLVVLPSAAIAWSDSERMQSFAAWNGQPETVFLQRGDGTSWYKARIFSPRMELAFAGHPTLGALQVALDAGLVHRTAPLRQSCGAGWVDLRIDGNEDESQVFFVKTPSPANVQALPADAAAGAARAIGCEPLDVYCVHAGANWLVAKLPGAAALAALCPDMAAILRLSEKHRVSGITVFAPAAGIANARYEVRSFGPVMGVPEDAVCGGGNACVAALDHYLGNTVASYLTCQGRFVGRDGRVHLKGPVDDSRYWVGGSVRTAMEGTLLW